MTNRNDRRGQEQRDRFERTDDRDWLDNRDGRFTNDQYEGGTPDRSDRAYYADRSGTGHGYMGYDTNQGSAREERGSRSSGRDGGAYGRMDGGDMYGTAAQRGLAYRDEARDESGYGMGAGASGGQRGPHYGRGPKNYRRSDERIREDILESLTYHHEVDASEMEVTVSDGEVTLSGTVPDRQQKRLAEDITEHVRGVRDVNNNLRVQGGWWANLKNAVTGQDDRDD